MPLVSNSYVDSTKIEIVSQKIADLASQTGKEQNSVAVTLKSPEVGKNESGSNRFGVDVLNYNGLFANSMQMTDGVLADGLTFSYEGFNLPCVNYVLTSGAFSNHQGKRGTLFDKYQVYLYSDKSNTNYSGYDNFCYVTERTAKEMMANDPSIQSYDDVINKTMTVRYGEISHSWKISNIIMDKEEFYGQMSNIYGDFIMAYVHLPGDLGKNVCLSAYFGTNTYLNMNKMTSLFSLDNPTYEVYRGNLGNSNGSTIDEIESFLNNYSENKILTYVYYGEIAALAIINSLCAWLYLRKKSNLKLIPLLGSVAGALIVGYLPFWIAYKATGSVALLSHMGVLGMMLVFAISAVFTLATYLGRRKEKHEEA